MAPKKILLLGGSKSQVVGIDRARQLGYETIVCDYLPDNPGRNIADRFYLVSTTDKEAVLDVAISEDIDGVVAYGSDPAAPTAAYVAEKLGLPGIPYKTAQSFCEKHLFREFLVSNGFNVPRSIQVDSETKVSEVADWISFPAIVKPTDSSGSKGVSVVRNIAEVHEAIHLAWELARNGVAIVEEFIERDHPFVIEAEIFVVDGKIRSWGLINSIRDQDTNPLLPAAYSYPLQQPEARALLVRQELTRLIEVSEIRYGALNLEMVIDKNDRLFFLDAGPRNGGNMLPEFIGMISGKDIVAATLHAAMGEYSRIDVDFDEGNEYWGLAVLHAGRNGKFAGVSYSDEALAHLEIEVLDKTRGDTVKRFDTCRDLIGLSFFRFEDIDSMRRVMEHPSQSMQVKVFE